MKFPFQIAFALATSLVAIVLAYAELRHGVSDMQAFRSDATKFHQMTARKIERLEIHVSHLQSWLDEVKVKR